MIFELIFIRHGESCANALHKAGIVGTVKHKFYKDPELTTRAKEESKLRGEKVLQPELAKSPEFADGNFTVGSSPLFRAQETAYLMIAKKSNKNIYIMSHIGETGFGGSYSYDNNPDDRDKQRATFAKRYPENAKFPFYDQSKIEGELAPDFEKFKVWMKEKKNPDSYFQQGNDGVYRAVIVSHSNSLRIAFPYHECLNPPKPPANITNAKQIKEWKANWKLNNNDFLVSVFKDDDDSLDGKNLLEKNAVYPKWKYFDTQMIQTKEVPMCGVDESCPKLAGVPISQPCNMPPKKGGSRKTRKQRKSRKYKHKRKATQRR